MTRREILSNAVNDCIKELYSLSQPCISWEEFKKECEVYTEKYNIWEDFNKAFHSKEVSPENWEIEKSKHPYWEEKAIKECIGPKPYEFYYLPKEVFKSVVESYEYAYELNKHEDLLNTIELLKEYCSKPIVDKYIDAYTDEDGDYHPGYRGYDHPDNLYKEISKIISNYSLEPASEDSDEVVDLCNKFFEFLNMAGKFYDWNGDLNSFRMSVYLGPTPNSNKDAVIANWKNYRKQEIKIDESKYDECEF